MNFKKRPELRWAVGKSSLILVFWDRVVDAVWLEQSMLGPSVRLMERFARDEQMPAQLVQRLQSAGKTPSRVLVCLPRAMVMQRTLLYPASVRNDLAQMLQFEALRHVPIPEADRRLAFSSMPLPGGKQIGVNLLATGKQDLEAFLEPLSAAGLPVDEVSSLSSLLAPAEGQVPVLQILSDVNRIELAFFSNGLLQDSLLLNRQAPAFGTETLVDAARRMAVRHRDLLGAEGIGRIVCSGPEPLPEEMQSRLGIAFGVHTHAPELPELLRPAVAAAGGTVLTEALCAVAAEPQPGLNLIDRTGRKVPLSRRTLVIAALCALLAVQLFAGWMVHLFSPAAALKKVEREAAELKRRAAPVLTVRTQNRSLRAELEQLDRLVKTRVSVMGMLKTLSDSLPDDTYLMGLEYTRGDEIRIRGRSKAPDRLPQLVQDLPFVKTIEESTIGEKENEYFGFRLSAALKELAR